MNSSGLSIRWSLITGLLLIVCSNSPCIHAQPKLQDQHSSDLRQQVNHWRLKILDGREMQLAGVQAGEIRVEMERLRQALKHETPIKLDPLFHLQSKLNPHKMPITLMYLKNITNSLRPAPPKQAHPPASPQSISLDTYIDQILDELLGQPEFQHDISQKTHLQRSDLLKQQENRLNHYIRWKLQQNNRAHYTLEEAFETHDQQDTLFTLFTSVHPVKTWKGQQQHQVLIRSKSLGHGRSKLTLVIPPLTTQNAQIKSWNKRTRVTTHLSIELTLDQILSAFHPKTGELETVVILKLSH